ncbi:MAG: hypothetical protein R3191_00380 [Anaerolineales bacterium]|nr:hypothetical protein [Anaerolineales bacterium]
MKTKVEGELTIECDRQNLETLTGERLAAANENKGLTVWPVDQDSYAFPHPVEGPI